MPHVTLATPLGPLRLVSDGAALTAATFAPVRLGPEAEGSDAVLDAARSQLAAYFDGEPVVFDVPLRLGGTPFQERVWAALCAIPHGDRVSYGTLAARVGMPKGAQAVGAANGQNPVAVIVPCHRVVGADGALVGYAGGLERKRALLDLESRQRRLL
ncbi:cysteine methyltransferase [Rubrivirga sp. SAORIC476]|uniref:methylated-DNA--[protein]-cysteine S-methyltransferase n=1 Tax=Rubrivirga sp. SAORIC476 TaxID=1961794 RepID=UPI000BA9A981|nr:methylated-DNA--[protein]-cysteine S-methyltransferase [Rubrivirga sp. SAORIC476]PAP79389.1 cysteine methyltransferase [Rubrivirga sp. SAORIC476]